MKKIILIAILVTVIIASGCIGEEQVTTPMARPINPVLFTNQSVNTLLDVGNLFFSYKETLWEFKNINGTPMNNFVKVKNFVEVPPHHVFTGNVGTINFRIILPYVHADDDYKIENGNVMISYCDGGSGSTAYATRVGETEICPPEKIAWKEAPAVHFWTNDLGTIFARSR